MLASLGKVPSLQAQALVMPIYIYTGALSTYEVLLLVHLVDICAVVFSRFWCDRFYGKDSILNSSDLGKPSLSFLSLYDRICD